MKSVNTACLMAAVLMLALGWYVRVVTTVEPWPLGQSLTELPAPPSPWRCEPDARGGAYRDRAVDESAVWACTSARGIATSVYLGYSDRQAVGKRLQSPAFNPLNRDSQWVVASKRVSMIQQAEDSPALAATRLVLRHTTGAQEAVVYWYRTGNRAMSSEWRFRAALGWRALWDRRTDALIVRLGTRVGDDDLETVFADQEGLAEWLDRALSQFPG